MSARAPFSLMNGTSIFDCYPESGILYLRRKSLAHRHVISAGVKI